jgi:hypothetical protein
MEVPKNKKENKAFLIAAPTKPARLGSTQVPQV